MEDYFINQDCRGFSIDSSTGILMSGYADYYVLLSDSPLELNKNSKALDDYCALNGLTADSEITKIVIFSKSGNSKAKKYKHFW